MIKDTEFCVLGCVYLVLHHTHTWTLVIGSRAQSEACLACAHQEMLSQNAISHPHNDILGFPSCTPPLLTFLPPLLLFRVFFTSHFPLLICHGNYSIAPNSIAKQVTATCVLNMDGTTHRGKIFHAHHKYALTDVYGCMHGRVKCFKRPPFCSPLLSHLAVCRNYGPNHSRKRHRIQEIWQQDKHAIVYDRESGRLQILVTTGDNISVACLYHMVSTKEESYLFIATGSTIAYLFKRYNLMIFHCISL